jgi:hypothetical protein
MYNKLKARCPKSIPFANYTDNGVTSYGYKNKT